MKSNLLKFTGVFAILLTSSYFSQAQTKYGDNLGTHKAAKDLNMNSFSIFNAQGILLGSASSTALPASVALQIASADRAIVISNIAANTDISTPLDGMIIYNTTDKAFYVRQDGYWVNLSTGSLLAGAVSTTGDAKGYVFEFDILAKSNTLRLTPATITEPGFVSTDVQSFAGAKTFTGDVAVDGTNNLTVGTGITSLGGVLNVADVSTLSGNTFVVGAATLSVASGATSLGGTLSVTGESNLNNNTYVTGASNLTVGTGATVLGGTLSVTGLTTLEGSAANGVIITGLVTSTDEADVVTTVSTTGIIKKSTFAPLSLGQFAAEIPAGTSAQFTDFNMGVEVVIAVLGIKSNDGIVVNVDLGSRSAFEGLSILNAVATADGVVTVTIADFRQPGDTFTAPAIDAANLVVTRYKGQ